MRLLIVRHAIADDREEWAKTGRPDGERPLTPRGVKRMRSAARGLAALVEKPDIIATSPLVRAVQTAEIAGKAWGIENLVEVGALSPTGEYSDLVAWLRSLKTNGTVVVVGHEPHLGGLASYMLTGRRESFVELKKGAACLIQLSEPPTPGVARLLWSLSPGQLRAIKG